MAEAMDALQSSDCMAGAMNALQSSDCIEEQ